jgi:hypothetical protein
MPPAAKDPKKRKTDAAGWRALSHCAISLVVLTTRIARTMQGVRALPAKLDIGRPSDGASEIAND